MSARIAYIICITQVILKTINNELLVYDLWGFLFYLKVSVKYTANEHGLDNYVKKQLKNLSLKVPTTVQPVFMNNDNAPYSTGINQIYMKLVSSKPENSNEL